MLLVLTAFGALMGPSISARALLPAATPCITMNATPDKLAKRASKLDSLDFTVGKSAVRVCYGRPALKGRTMLGGADVPYGKLWRTGANEPTMIHTSGTIMVGDLTLPPGTYSLYSVPGEKSWEIIVNKSITQWGKEDTYTPEVQKQEIGRTTVKAETLAAPVELFTISAAPDAKNTTALVLTWQKTKVSIPLMPM